MANRHQDFITLARQHAAAIWEASTALLEMQKEWNALDYGNTLPDGEGGNTGYSKTEVGSVVFDTANEIKLRILDTGHATNLAKLL